MTECNEQYYNFDCYEKDYYCMRDRFVQVVAKIFFEMANKQRKSSVLHSRLKPEEKAMYCKFCKMQVNAVGGRRLCKEIDALAEYVKSTGCEDTMRRLKTLRDYSRWLKRAFAWHNRCFGQRDLGIYDTVSMMTEEDMNEVNNWIKG